MFQKRISHSGYRRPLFWGKYGTLLVFYCNIWNVGCQYVICIFTKMCVWFIITKGYNKKRFWFIAKWFRTWHLTLDVVTSILGLLHQTLRCGKPTFSKISMVWLNQLVSKRTVNARNNLVRFAKFEANYVHVIISPKWINSKLYIHKYSFILVRLLFVWIYFLFMIILL